MGRVEIEMLAEDPIQYNNEPVTNEP